MARARSSPEGPTDLAWVGPPWVGEEPYVGCGVSTRIRVPGSPTRGTWTRRVNRRHPLRPGRSRASLDRILQLAYRAGPPLPPAIASARCSLFLREHVRHGTRKYFCSPAEKAESGRSPRRRSRRIAGGWTRGSGPGSVALKARRLHRFPRGFFVGHIMHGPEDRVYCTNLSELQDVKERLSGFLRL